MHWPVSLKKHFRRVWWFQKTNPFSAADFQIFLTFTSPLPRLGFFLKIACFGSVSLSPSFFSLIRTHIPFSFFSPPPPFITRNRGEDRITQTVKGCQTAEFSCFVSSPFISHTAWSPLLSLKAQFQPGASLAC